MSVQLLLLALLLAPAPLTVQRGGHVSEGDPRSQAIYPPQRISVAFDHQAHVELVGLTCLDCHGAATESRKTKDYLVPPKEICLDCHDAVELPFEWGPKHRKAENTVALPPARLHFPHAVHVDLMDVSCSTCHAGVETAQLATVEHLPPMETCLQCHDGFRASDDCTTCHEAGRGGTIRTAYPTGTLVPDDHGVHWLKQHEIAAERDLASCASCHAQSDCLECHEGSLPPVFHDGNYLAQHPRDALANNPTCGACHRLESFCRDCHFKAGVRLFDRIPFQGFHPAGWGDFPGPGGELPDTHHSRVAKKNLLSCTACHAEEDCRGCHSWYPGAPRTHGPGWAGSDRMRRIQRENPGLCLQCHDPANPDDPINAP